MKNFILSMGIKSVVLKTIHSFHWFVALTFVLGFLIPATQTFAASTWTGGVSKDWNTNNNWSPTGVPNSTATTVIFGGAATGGVTLSGSVSEAGVSFSSGSYLINLSNNVLSLQGFGVTNTSGSPETILNGGTGTFSLYNSASLGNINYTNGATLSLNGTSDAGSASVTNSGTMLFNNTTSAGNATINNSGTLDFFNTSTAASAVITNYAGGTVSFVGVADGGTAAFTNSSGATIDISASLSSSVTLGSVAGGGSFNLGANNLATGGNNNSTTVTGVLSGSGGSLTKLGTGILTLTGTNTYTGSTTVNGGTLALSGSGTAGSGAGALVVSGGATFDMSGSTGSVGVGSIAGAGALALGTHILYAGSDNTSTLVSGVLLDGGLAGGAAGSLTKMGTGTLTLSGTNTYTGGTVVNGGTLAVTGTGTLGSGTLFLVSAGDNFDISGASTAVTVGSISGAGTILLGANNFKTNGNNATSSYSGVLADGGIVAGTGGSLTKLGTGTLTLSGVNTYTGATTVGMGTLALSGTGTTGGGALVVSGGATFDISASSGTVGVGSIAGSGSITLGNGTLSTGFDNTSTTFSGVISGANGLLAKSGAGTLTLTGSNTYVYGTQVASGTLAVGNSQALGTGNLWLSGGVLQTNGAPLAITIGGSYSQSAGTTLQLGLGGTGAGQWDKLNIAGGASLNGTLNIVSYASFQPVIGDDFQLITASGAVTGQFSTVVNPFTNVRLFPYYANGGLTLEAVPNSFAQVPGITLTANETAVGQAIDKVYGDAVEAKLIGQLGTLSAGSLPTAYDQISPAVLTPLYQMGFGLAQARAAVIAERMDNLWGTTSPRKMAWNTTDGYGSPLFAGKLSAAHEARIARQAGPSSDTMGVFLEATGDLGTINGDPNAAGYQITTYGVNAGLDTRLGKDMVGGLLLGYGMSGTTPVAGGSVSMTGGQAGLYGGWSKNGAYVQALVDAGLDNFQTQRAGFGGSATGTAQGLQFSGEVGGGYDFHVSKFNLGPFASGQYTTVQLSSFTESGSTAPLSFPAQSEASLKSQVGGRAERTWKFGNLQLTPDVSAAWEHEFMVTQDALSASLASGAAFTVNGPALGQDLVVAGASVNLKWSPTMSAYLRYQGKFGLTNGSAHNGGAGFNLAF